MLNPKPTDGRHTLPMTSKPSPPRYTALAIVLHWLLALMIVASFGVGLYMSDLPISPTRLKLYNWHKWAGVTILALSGLRLLWRLTHRPPAAATGWQAGVAQATHVLLYALFFVVPLLGWAYSSAAGFPVVWFGLLQLPDFVPVDKLLAEAIKPWHERSAMMMAGLVLLHVAGAAKHQWLDRDGLMQRMLPGRS